MILSVFVSLCDGCKPSEQRVSLDPRCNFFTQCYKGCSANSMASTHPFPELTGVPQSHSHFVNVIFNFGNILLFMCCFCLLTQLSRLVHFLSVVYCSALIVQLSGLVHFLSVVYCSALIVQLSGLVIHQVHFLFSSSRQHHGIHLDPRVVHLRSSPLVFPLPGSVHVSASVVF